MAFINQYLLICHTDIIGKSGGNAKPFKYLPCDIVENENIFECGAGEWHEKKNTHGVKHTHRHATQIHMYRQLK